MRILILGNDYSAQSFFDLFCKNKNNIVFSTKTDCNCINLFSTEDIIDFACANEINFALVIAEEYINTGIAELLAAKG